MATAFTPTTPDMVQAAHGAMQRHIPDQHNPQHCAACGDTYPCDRRQVAIDVLVAAGHLVLPKDDC